MNESISVYEAIRAGWCQARVIRDLTPFKTGEEVDIDLIQNGLVAVWESKYETMNDCIKQGGRYEEYNLDTQEDYDNYFQVY